LIPLHISRFLIRITFYLLILKNLYQISKTYKKVIKISKTYKKVIKISKTYKNLRNIVKL